jgi:predicted nucleotidyltransferase
MKQQLECLGVDIRMKLKNIELPMEQIKAFCDRWQVIEFALFGSILGDDFRPDSDIDVLITFSPTAKRGLTETLQMRDELQAIFDRKVDLIVKAAIERSENWLRRKNIGISRNHLCRVIKNPLSTSRTPSNAFCATQMGSVNRT